MSREMDEGLAPVTTVAMFQSQQSNQSSVVVEWLRLMAQFADPSVSEEVKGRCLQEIIKNLERILSHPVSQKSFLESGIPSFITALERLEPNFIENTPRHYCRKMIIEIFRRLATHTINNVALLQPPQVSMILSLMFKTAEVDNEDNVISCLRVISILHTNFKPDAIEGTKAFFRWIRNAFLHVQVKPEALYWHKFAIDSAEISKDGGILRLLDNVFAVTPIIFKGEETKTLTLIPKGINSLKVLQELPIRALRLHQFYKELLQEEVAQLLPVIISTLALHPAESQKESPQFNKKIYLELISIQLKTLSLVAYLIKHPPFQQSILEHSDLIALGFINVLKYCPPEVVLIRLEAFRAIIPLLKPPLVLKFVPHVAQLFDADSELLHGKGWTSTKNQELRRFSSKFLVDLVIHTKQQLSVENLLRAIHFSAVQLLDETNSFVVQGTFTKLLASLAETMLQKLKPEKKEEGRAILFRLLEICICKLKRVGLVHLPRFLVDKDGAEAQSLEFKTEVELKPKGFTLLEAQSLVKALVLTVKNIGWLIKGKKMEKVQSQNQSSNLPLKPFSSEEVDIYVEVMKWGVKAMRIFVESPSQDEEKQAWKGFGLIFGSLNPYVFRQVCESTIENLVEEEIGHNPAVKQLVNNFLAEVSTSSIFSSVMLQFLLEKMELLGSESGEKKALYLTLFRMIWGALKLFPVENELMLQPFFSQIIKNAMEFGKSSKEPVIYFQLLLELFNALCKGQFEVLHQEFLILLPNFIRDLMRFRGGILPQKWDELVIRLSLDFPARLCNLFPYLPILLECLVAALNSSTSPFLVSLGLKKLEFLVESMPAQFSSEAMTLVHTELVQALWKILQDSEPLSANGTSAFRILGRLGGITRKAMINPQKLNYFRISGEDRCIQLQFLDDHPLSINFPIENVVDVALTKLISPDTDFLCKNQCWQLLKGVVLVSLSIKGETDRLCSLRYKNGHVNFYGMTGSSSSSSISDSNSEKYRQVFENALKGWLIGATLKETTIRKDVLYCLAPTLRRIAMVMTAQHLSYPTLPNMFVVFDTIVNAFASDEKELRRIALYSLSILLKSLIQLMHTKDNAFASPMVNYFTEKMCCLFYDATWKGKMGGVEALAFLLENENAPLSWIYANHVPLLRALFFLLKDVNGQVSGGVQDIAKENLTKLIQLVCKDERSSMDLSGELIKRITSPSPLVRDESLRGLNLVANLIGKTISEIVQPHLFLILKEINPSKLLLRLQSVQHQLGILDGLYFYLTSAPNLLPISWNVKEHHFFIKELLVLGEAGEGELKKLASYKSCSPANLELVQKGVMRVLSTITDLPPPESQKIVSIFLLKLSSTNEGIQNVAFESLRQLMKSQASPVQIPIEVQQTAVQNVLKQFSPYSVGNPDPAVAQQLCYICQLFPSIFSEKLLNTFVHIFRKTLELTVNAFRKKPTSRSFGLQCQLDLGVKILECFSYRTLKYGHLENTKFSQFLKVLTSLCLDVEKFLSFGKEGSPLRKPLIKLFLRHHQHDDYLSFLLTPGRATLFFNLIEEIGGESLRSYLFNDPSALVKLLTVDNNDDEKQVEHDKEQTRLVALKGLIILNKFDEEWIAGEKGKEVAETLIKLWKSREYQKEFKAKQVPGANLETNLRSQLMEEPVMICKLLLNFYRKNQEDYELLFQLVCPFSWKRNRAYSDFKFLQQFFHEEIPRNSTTWKRQAILEYVKFYKDPSVDEEVKARVIQAVLIPCLISAFEKNEEELLKGSSSQACENASKEEENLVHLLISQILSPLLPNETTKKLGDELNIALLQLWTLLVNQAPPQFVDNPEILKKLEVLARPFASAPAMDVDLCVKYHAYLLLCHICAKSSNSCPVTLKIFTNLLNASDVPVEAKGIVYEALKIIIPAFLKMEDGEGAKQLYWETAKFLKLDEACPSSFSQLAHILKVIVQNWKSYYGGRHFLLEFGQLLPALNRLFLGSEEHKMLVLNVAETIFNWEKMWIELNKKGDETTPSSAENKPLNPLQIRVLLRLLFHFAYQSGPPNVEVAKRSKNLLSLMLQLELWQNHLNFVDFGWMNKSLHSGNLGCVAALEILTFAIGLMSKEAVLRNVGVLQQGIILCINFNIISNPAPGSAPNGKGIQAALLNLMEKLMSFFPFNVSSCEVLKPIYDNVMNLISNGLEAFYMVGVQEDNFLSSIMMLKAVYESSDSSYVGPLMDPLIKCLEKLSDEKTSQDSTSTVEQTSSKCIVMALKLAKSKVPFLTEELQNKLILTLVSFLKNSSNKEILECVIEMVQDWIVDENHEGLIQMKGLKLLILKIGEMENNLLARGVKGKEELTKLFLRLVLTLYQEEKFEGTELDLRSQLKPAFFRGFSQEEMREQFFKIIESKLNRQVCDRLLYILSYQDWGMMGTHFWIKECIHLVLATVNGFMEDVDGANPLPKVDEEQEENEMEVDQDDFIVEGLEDPNSEANVGVKACKNDEFTSILETFNIIKMVVKPTIQLCYLESPLAETVWISLLPKLWQALSPQQSLSLANEVPLFLMSGVHLPQQFGVPSALATFFEALCHCSPAIPLQPSVLYHLGKTHNLWHRSALLLEKLVNDFVGGANGIPAELRDSLAELYSELGEEDLWAGLWRRAALLEETKAAVDLEQQGGSYGKAQEMLEVAMNKMMLMDGSAAADGDIAQIGEARLLEENWLKCAKELNEWEMIQDYTETVVGSNPLMHLESLWRKRDWLSSHKILLSLNLDEYPREHQWSLELIRGYYILCSGKEKQIQVLVPRFADRAQHFCIKEWRSLPRMVGSGAHVRVLQAAQRVVELREATSLHRSLLANRFNEVEQIVKIWETRRPSISDSLSHWEEILEWRTLNYHFIANYVVKQRDEGTIIKEEKAGEIANRKLFGVHAAVQALCQYGKVARKHGLPKVGLEALEKVYEIPKVPVKDCFEKLKQQFKCYMVEGRLETGRKLLEQTNLGYFGKDVLSEFLSLKGRLLVKMGEGEEANKAYSASCQLNPDKVGRNWAHWAEYLESCFVQTRNQIEMGVSAVTAFMRACQHKNEVKSRKYIAKVLWLLEYDDEKGTLAASVNESSEQIPPSHWLVWIPQLLTFVTEKEVDGREMGSNILNRVGSLYPQAIFFPLRSLYLALKSEQLEKLKLKKEETQTIRATPSMWRCSKIMQFQRACHPALVTNLEKMAEELAFSREGWPSEVLKFLRNILAHCYEIAFENRTRSALDPRSASAIVKQLRKLLFGFHLPRQFAQEPIFLSRKAEFQYDFGSLISGKLDLVIVMQKVVKWIRILEEKTNKECSIFMCQDRCKLMSSFSMDIADVKLPGEFLSPKPPHCFVRIVRFEPKVDVIVKRGLNARRLFIRGNNGKVYPYLVTINLEDGHWEKGQREERFAQLLRMLNHFFGKQKETAKRNMKFVVPKLVAISPQLRLVEDHPESLSLLEVFRLHCSKKGFECDSPVLSYYEKVGDIQRKCDQLNGDALRKIFQDIQRSFAPREMMRDWAHFNYLTPSDYWMFRKTFTSQLCLNNVAEYVLQGTSAYPEMINIHKDSGLVNISCFKFGVDNLTKGNTADSNTDQVPFRLTPNLREFLTGFGATGPLVYGMMAVAKCLSYPNYKLDAILRPILKDEMITHVKMTKGGIGIQEFANGKEVNGTFQETGDSEAVINLVNNAVYGIMTRLADLAVVNGTESKVRMLVDAASNDDNLCQMDPTWHPWL